MRLFIAIDLADDVRMHLMGVRDDLRPRIPSSAGFTRDDNLHITLKFLGEVDDKQLVELIESLAKVTAGGVIETFAQAIECFPDRGPVRIVAAGFGGSVEALRGLHQAIEQRCQHLGFNRETRLYRPHVTLARARPILPASVRQDAPNAARGLLPGPTMTVDEFALVESHLKPSGAEYRTVHRFRLRHDRSGGG